MFTLTQGNRRYIIQLIGNLRPSIWAEKSLRLTQKENEMKKKIKDISFDVLALAAGAGIIVFGDGLQRYCCL